jgi:hypothetical protein
MHPAHPGMLGLACLAAILACFGFHPEWDSGRIVAGFAAIVAGIAALLMALPRPIRRLGVSLLVLFHFGGILVAVTADRPRPWISHQLHRLVYRPYLEFTYLDYSYQFNSYGKWVSHFKWFCIVYENGDTGWYKLREPRLEGWDPLGIQGQRYLELAVDSGSYADDDPSDDDKRKRLGHANVIPLHADRTVTYQYKETGQFVQFQQLPALTRHLCHRHDVQHPDGHTRIKSVKVYDVVHRIVQPDELRTTGINDRQTYEPYYQGEIDPTGKEINKDDPMRFWLVPIFYKCKSFAPLAESNPRDNPGDYILIDGLKLHTGSDAFRE